MKREILLPMTTMVIIIIRYVQIDELNFSDYWEFLKRTKRNFSSSFLCLFFPIWESCLWPNAAAITTSLHLAMCFKVLSMCIPYSASRYHMGTLLKIENILSWFVHNSQNLTVVEPPIQNVQRDGFYSSDLFYMFHCI